MLSAKNRFLILFILWIITQSLLLLQYGVITNNEAIKYTREAHNLLAHKPLSEHKYIFYSAYILIHCLFIKLGIEVIGVYLFQLILNLAALYCFYQVLITVYKKEIVAFIGCVLLIICIPWQYWVVCLYTESVFCSLIIIFMYCLFVISESHRFKYLYSIIILIILLFSRPTGIFFIPVFAVVIAIKLWRIKKQTAIISAVVFSGIFISLIVYATTSAESYNFIKPFIDHNVICDVPENPSVNSYGTGSNAVLLFIKSNPTEFLRLCFLRFISFWSLTRSYYSQLHNWLLRLFFYPLYFFGVTCLLEKVKANISFNIFCLTTITVFTISVMLTCDEWSSRFIMPIIPIIICLAAHGIYIFMRLFKKVIISSV